MRYDNDLAIAGRARWELIRVTPKTGKPRTTEVLTRAVALRLLLEKARLEQDRNKSAIFCNSRFANMLIPQRGGMTERLKVAVLKTVRNIWYRAESTG